MNYNTHIDNSNDIITNNTIGNNSYNEIIKSLRYILCGDSPTEMRIICKDGRILVGYYSDIEKMAKDARDNNHNAKGVYFVPNPIKSNLSSNCDNELRRGNATGDSDIEKRNWLLIDCDPERPAGQSSTDEEKHKAKEIIKEIRQYLSDSGFPLPIFADSSNGYHLMYRINIPANDNGLIERVLSALSVLFLNDRVKVDTTVHNPSRIWKLYGTISRKGDDTIDRPHRQALIDWDESPEELEIVPVERLEAIANTISTDVSHSLNVSRPNQNRLNVDNWIKNYSISVIGPLDWKDGKKWVFNTCPWNPIHTNKSAFIVQFKNGAIAAGCHHNSCQGNNWQSLRKMYEPDYTEVKTNSFQLTDYGNAERLVSQHGDALRYSHSQSTWYYWNGKLWLVDDLGKVMGRAKETVRNILQGASTVENDDKRKEIVAWAVKSESNNRLKAMVELAQSEGIIPIKLVEFDKDPYLLNCDNGTLNLRSVELLPHNRDALISKITPTIWRGLDYKFDLWDQLLDDWAGGDQEIKNFLQRAVGYSLTGSICEEKLFFIHGPTASGKSTFIDAIKFALGDYTRTADFETFLKRKFGGGVRNDIARLAGSRIVFSIEVDKGTALAEGLIKTLTGGDEITARFLYKEATEFRPTFTLWLVANDAPDLSSDDEAMWRRILRIPFDHTIPANKRDKGLKDRLRSPEISSAVLSWAVRGCLEWQSEGLKEPAAIIESTAEYRHEVDDIMQFINDCCELGDDLWDSTSKLFNAFQSWASNNGEATLTNNRPLTAKLKTLNCIPKSSLYYGHKARGWCGIRVKDNFKKTYIRN